MYFLALCFVIYLPCWSQLFCNAQQSRHAQLKGPSVSSIPNGMEPTNMTHLKIFNTNIQTLDLRQLLPYTSLHNLDVETSPVTRVVTADLPALKYLHLNSLNMVVPPQLGSLSTRLEGLGLSDSNLTTIPDNYFSNFTGLKSLGLNNLGLTTFNESWLEDLNRLQKIYVAKNPLVSLSPLHIWLRNLKSVYAADIGLTTIPVALIKAMQSPGMLKLTDNNITGVPQRYDFEPMTKWEQINLKGNPLHCDESLCWIKVTWKSVRWRVNLPIQETDSTASNRIKTRK